MSFDKIIVECDGPLAVVTLYDPARLNAINLSMLQGSRPRRAKCWVMDLFAPS
ncbi:MAG: hypothetical protein Q8R02_08845 [Hyphomonadaceae bacterium]|nr:hypothetical protein [Hyphomonadaceae bacterium]